MSDNISRSNVLMQIEQIYEDIGVDMHGIWNKQAAEILMSKDVEDLRLFLHSILEVVRHAQSTDRKGHWIQKDYYDTDWNVYECDQCGEPWQLETGTPKDNNMNFCPHCGADMRGDRDV